MSNSLSNNFGSNTIDNVKNENHKNVKIFHSLNVIDGGKTSPIDINVTATKQLQLPLLLWYNYEKLPKKMKLTNTGKTLILSVKWSCERPHIYGGPLKDKYIFSQIHFHWGKTALEGSEHTIDGNRMPVEMHAIHFKLSYLNQTEALKHSDGVICLVYFFQIRSNHNPIVQEIVSTLNRIQIANTTISISPFQITKLIYPFEYDYYLYWGHINSIENDTKHIIMWFISREITNLSFEQLRLFRQLLNNKLCPIIRNWRKFTENLNYPKQTLFHINPTNKFTNSTLSPISLRLDQDRIQFSRKNSIQDDYVIRALMDEIRGSVENK